MNSVLPVYCTETASMKLNKIIKKLIMYECLHLAHLQTMAPSCGASTSKRLYLLPTAFGKTRKKKYEINQKTLTAAAVRLKMLKSDLYCCCFLQVEM